MEDVGLIEESDQVAIPVVYEDEVVRISGIEGGSDCLFVAFTGIGNEFRAFQTEEFVGTAHAHGKNTVLFVHDKLRSWFNEPSIADKVAEYVAQWASRCDRVVTIGNSMGGFGAIVLADRLNARTAIAFGPQFSVSPREMPREKRWKQFTSRITDFIYETAEDGMVPETTYFVIHGDAGKDWHHIRRFPHRPNLFHFVIPEEGHSIAGTLKQRGDLGTIVDLCLSHDIEALKSILILKNGAVLRSEENDPYAGKRPRREPKAIDELSRVEMLRQFRKTFPKEERAGGETPEESDAKKAAMRQAFARSVKDGSIQSVLVGRRSEIEDRRREIQERRQAEKAERQLARELKAKKIERKADRVQEDSSLDERPLPASVGPELVVERSGSSQAQKRGAAEKAQRVSEAKSRKEAERAERLALKAERKAARGERGRPLTETENGNPASKAAPVPAAPHQSEAGRHAIDLVSPEGPGAPQARGAVATPEPREAPAARASWMSTALRRLKAILQSLTRPTPGL